MDEIYEDVNKQNINKVIEALSKRYPKIANLEPMLKETVAHETQYGQFNDKSQENPWQLDPAFREDVFLPNAPYRRQRFIKKGSELSQYEGVPEPDELPISDSTQLAMMRYLDFNPEIINKNVSIPKLQGQRFHTWGEKYNRGGAYKRDQEATKQVYINNLKKAGLYKQEEW